MIKEIFAPGYDRDDEGRVLFPRTDTDLRNLYFTYTDSTVHVAKCNGHMILELVKYVSEPGETVLDPFGGTGTILLATTLGRKVIAIELEEIFQKTIELNIQALGKDIPDIDDKAMLIPGDVMQVLPLYGIADHAMFSPPWANVLRKKAVDQFTIDAGYGAATNYTESPENIGNLSDFLYHQVMERFYKKMFETIKPGGTMTIIIKDRIEKGKRIYQGKRAERDCIKIGFEPVAWNKWYAIGGGFAAYNRSIGLETVDEEDLITLRRPQ
ncbi:MAG: hypothetical protein M0R06_00375 [Sphaerochaeta sp.]|nr:hypothetical protein [Sphaerochaeta sp.]